jgi:hypothetical protein
MQAREYLKLICPDAWRLGARVGLAPGRRSHVASLQNRLCSFAISIYCCPVACGSARKSASPPGEDPISLRGKLEAHSKRRACAEILSAAKDLLFESIILVFDNKRLSAAHFAAY